MQSMHHLVTPRILGHISFKTNIYLDFVLFIWNCFISRTAINKILNSPRRTYTIDIKCDHRAFMELSFWSCKILSGRRSHLLVSIWLKSSDFPHPLSSVLGGGSQDDRTPDTGAVVIGKRETANWIFACGRAGSVVGRPLVRDFSLSHIRAVVQQTSPWYR